MKKSSIYILIIWLALLIGFVIYVPFAEYTYLSDGYYKTIEVKHYAWVFWVQEPSDRLDNVLRINYNLILLKIIVTTIISFVLVAINERSR